MTKPTHCPFCGEGYASHDQVKDAWEASAELDHLRAALRSIAGKKRPSGAYCQRVAEAALERPSTSA